MKTSKMISLAALIALFSSIGLAYGEGFNRATGAGIKCQLREGDVRYVSLAGYNSRIRPNPEIYPYITAIQLKDIMNIGYDERGNNGEGIFNTMFGSSSEITFNDTDGILEEFSGVTDDPILREINIQDETNSNFLALVGINRGEMQKNFLKELETKKPTRQQIVFSFVYDRVNDTWDIFGILDPAKVRGGSLMRGVYVNAINLPCTIIKKPTSVVPKEKSMEAKVKSANDK